MIDRSCNNNLSSTAALAFSSCYGQMSCSFSVDNTFFNTSISQCNNSAANYYTIFVVNCKSKCHFSNIFTYFYLLDDQITLFGDTVTDKLNLTYVAFINDIIIIFVYLLMAWSLRYAREKTENNVLNQSA